MLLTQDMTEKKHGGDRGCGGGNNGLGIMADEDPCSKQHLFLLPKYVLKKISIFVT